MGKQKDIVTDFEDIVFQSQMLSGVAYVLWDSLAKSEPTEENRIRSLAAYFLYDQMEKLFETYGYFREELCTVTKRGLEGAREIAEILETLRNDIPKSIGGMQVEEFRDYREDTVWDYRSKEAVKRSTGLPRSNVLYFELEKGAWCCVRPSGTEPKIKFYVGVKGTDKKDAEGKMKTLMEALNDCAKN